jgi:hypothetical protein
VSNLLPVFKCSPAEPRFNYDYSAEEIVNSVVQYYLPGLKRFSFNGVFYAYSYAEMLVSAIHLTVCGEAG